jgi:hypothetical protein
MFRVAFTLLAVSIILCANTAMAFQYRINPYVPHNAVPAVPETPYNLDEIEKCGRLYYAPCPTCTAGGMDLPERPTVFEPFPGPFCVPVPVP